MFLRKGRKALWAEQERKREAEQETIGQSSTLVRPCVRDIHGGRHATTRDVTAFGLAAGTQTLDSPTHHGTSAER